MFLTKLLLLIFLSYTTSTTIIPLAPPTCPRSTGTSGALFYPTPSAPSVTTTCSQYPEGCCRDDVLNDIQSGADHISTYLNTALQPSSLSGECLGFVEKLACTPCAPDSGVWLELVSGDSFRMDVCQSFCDEFYAACSGAIVSSSGDSVAVEYSTAAAFCYGAFGNTPDIYLTVLSSSERNCFDSERPACTENDIGYYYTECESGKRQLIYYWHPDTNCAGGVSLPQSVSNLNCPIDCPQGSYLGLGESQCSVCPAGTYSRGGARRVQDWQNFPRTNNAGLSFETYCTDKDGTPKPTEECAGWIQRVEGTASFIESNIAGQNNIISVLRTDVSLVEDGYVSFLTKIDSEWSYDRLVFVLDDGSEHWIQNQVEQEIVTFNLTAGFHTLKWKFKKDFSLSHGEDQAVIWWIEVSGLHYHSDYCYDCIPGYFSDPSSSECQICEANQISGPKSSACTDCAPSEYSFPGDSTCTPRAPCTEDDIEITYTPCTEAHRRTRQYIWEEPFICDPTAPGSVTLPEDEEADCEDCNPGQYRVGDTCLFCEPGFWSIIGTENACNSCEAGTYAPPVLSVHRWFEWLPFMRTHCTGLCGTSGWRLRGEYADSGIDHGSNTESVLNIDIDIVDHVRRSVEYNVELLCGASFCYLEVYLDQNLQYIHWDGNTDGIAQFFIDDITPGPHVLSFVFTKFLAERDSERARLHNITVWGSSVGGAHQCDDCSAGTAASEEAVFCEVCQEGTYSEDKAGECSLCPENTYNDELGASSCKPCGPNTYTPPGSGICSINECVFVDGENTYDLNGLSRDETMWGPVLDPYDDHSYYINPCSLAHTNYSCYEDDGSPMITYVCQHVGQWGHATSLGDVMGYSPYDNDGEYGVILEFSDGTPGCGNEFLEQPDVPRSARVSVICDPEAGVGVFEGENPIYQGTVYPDVCNYGLRIRSIYGCPVCTSSQYHQVHSACLDGVQEISYAWNTNPKNCHDGVSLPESVYYNCSSSTECGPGEKVNIEDECVECEDGYFSIGNGLVFESFETVAPFQSSCEGDSCDNWFVSNGNLVSGTDGESTLTITRNFILEENSYISFEYQFNGAEGSSFTFSVDDKKSFTITGRTFKYQSFTKNLGPGTHQFVWTFTQAENYPAFENQRRSFVSIRKISIEGIFGAIPFCYECPNGLAPNEDKSECQECGINTVSNGIGCSECPANTYRLPGQTSCMPQPACSKDIHFDAVYSDCVGGKTTKTYMPLTPSICRGTTPAPEEVDCPPCPEGTHLHDGECHTCKSHDGGYYDEASDDCISSPPGSQYYFTTFYNFDYMNTLPEEFETSCNGACATYGWQLHSDAVVSGRHYGEAESILSLKTEIADNHIVNPTVSFSVVASAASKRADGSVGIEVLVDGVLQEIPFDQNDGTEYQIPLTTGEHTITWIAHSDGTSNSQLRLVHLAVIGTKSGEASNPIPCPPGTFNGDENGQCQICPAGTYSSEAGSTECTSCEGNTIAPFPGSDSCFSCGQTSQASEDKTECTTDCMFVQTRASPLKDALYDLHLLDSRFTVLGEKRKEYSVGVCEKFTYQECSSEGDCTTYKNFVYSSQVVDDYEYSYGLGTIVDFIPDSEASFDGVNQTLHAFDLAFRNGTHVPPGCPESSATVRFYCDLSKGLGYPTFVSATTCHSTFRWESSHACRICSEDDFTLERTECVDGKQGEVAEKLNTCMMPYDFEYQVHDCVSHSFDDATLLVVVGLALFLFIGLVIFGIVNFCQRRKAVQRYELLEMKFEDENDAL